MYAKKPRLNGLALAFRQGRPGQSQLEAVITARLGLAYFGRAWLGSRPQAGPEKHYPQRRVRVLAGQGKGLAGSAGIKTLGRLQYPWELSERLN